MGFLQLISASTAMRRSGSDMTSGSSILAMFRATVAMFVPDFSCNCFAMTSIQHSYKYFEVNNGEMTALAGERTASRC